MSIELVMPSNHLILCHVLLLLPSILPSIRVFSSESVLHIRWPKYWSFSFCISPSSDYLELIVFRIDCFDLAVQGTLKSLFQHHNLKASIFWHSAFFTVQLLTSVHGYQKNHSFDYTDLCWQSQGYHKKYHTSCGLNKRNIFSHGSGGYKSKVKVSAGLASF